MLVNLCYVSRAMGVMKVSNSKGVTLRVEGHWQWCHSIGHMRFPISLPLQLCLYLQCCTLSEILPLIFQNLKRSRDSEHIPLESNTSCMHSYASVLISTKFEVPSFTNYKDMIGSKWKERSRDSDHAPFMGGLSPWARIWCSLPACIISRF